MTSSRWQELMTFGIEELTEAEIADGWHWCHDFDGLLVGPYMEELNYCHCPDEDN